MTTLQIIFASIGTIGIIYGIYKGIVSSLKNRPTILHMSYQYKRNLFNITIYNNASRLLRIKKAYKGKFWFFRKQMSVGMTMPNNKAHSDNFAKQKLNNLDLNSGGKEKNCKMYVKLDEDVSEKMFYFKTKSGTCKKKSEKIIIQS